MRFHQYRLASVRLLREIRYNCTEIRLCAIVRPRVPCVSCVSRLPPVSFYRVHQEYITFSCSYFLILYSIHGRHLDMENKQDCDHETRNTNGDGKRLKKRLLFREPCTFCPRSPDGPDAVPSFRVSVRSVW